MLKPMSLCKVLPGLGVVLPLVRAEAAKQSRPVLTPISFRRPVEEFNRNDVEWKTTYVHIVRRLVCGVHHSKAAGTSSLPQLRTREILEGLRSGDPKIAREAFLESTAWFWREYHDIEVDAL
jgi:hypothetical protein